MTNKPPVKLPDLYELLIREFLEDCGIPAMFHEEFFEMMHFISYESYKRGYGRGVTDLAEGKLKLVHNQHGRPEVVLANAPTETN